MVTEVRMRTILGRERPAVGCGRGMGGWRGGLKELLEVLSNVLFVVGCTSVSTL